VLAEDVHINFVEVKNSQIAAHSKANHLAYIGDATIGSRVNMAPAPSPATTMAPTSSAR
jgi:bifunctional UDP-N-acetylglucosamine pyrophosphorylase/glucosamine-1-phosphate N-acetyltransferase